MPESVGLKIQVNGIVQGVGFRPFVYNTAIRLNLTGWVRNTSGGVEIEISGDPEHVQLFLSELRTNPPPLAHIDQISQQPCQPNEMLHFEIQASQPQAGQFIPVSPDTSICPDCQRELFDPADRRYRYPFINCTNCGPRFTIIQDIPYDRPNTTMAGFHLCPDCLSEYHNPLDRRFHAQPIACPVCGPTIWYEENGCKLEEGETALKAARTALMQGKILAVKGLGGYHLACDASNSSAVRLLRERKKRSDKAFALMAFNLDAIEKHAVISTAERSLITAHQRPIVLLERAPRSSIVPEVAPYQNTLGFMLPYTPLHLLLVEPEPGFPEVLVMTSGNLSDEPIAFADEDALQRLSPLADAFLMHNRPIFMRVDDSVVYSVNNIPQISRRARGYAPDPIRLPRSIPSVLATGAELKNTFCLTRDHYAFLSHHIGDMENYETLVSFEQGIEHYKRLFRVQPEIIACDQHPNYLASRYARQLSQEKSLPLVEVQHHHAHLAACLAENHWDSPEPVIGLSLDGTGYGTDGAIWGGEILLGGYSGYQRAFHLKYVPIPGGDITIRKPARMALAWLWSAGLDWDEHLPCVQALCYEERTALRLQLQHQLNAPLTSSMGRLFDAIAALIGIREETTYEGQAAIELETYTDERYTNAYPFDITQDILDPHPMIHQIVSDWHASVSPQVISTRFHNGVVNGLLDACNQIRQNCGVNTVALSGGVWQNRYLFKHTVNRLNSGGFKVLTHHQVPPNDGCIALGQAMVAASVTKV